MVLYTDEIATTTGAAVAFTGMTGSPYIPLRAGRLRKIELHIGCGAATSLVEQVKVRLTSPDWGVPVFIINNGDGLRTVPQVQLQPTEEIVDLPVTQSTKITIEYMHSVATAVTPTISVIGTFEA
jgi:hypothetical protein